MAKKKRQHYVPKFYMHLFSEDGKRFAVYNVENQETYYPVPYGDQCYKNYFYGVDGILEDELANMETEWSVSIQKILKKESLTDDDIKNVKKFALYQRHRTLAEENFSIRTRKEVVLEEAKAILRSKNLNFDSSTLEDYSLSKAKESINPGDNLQFVAENLDVIDDLSVLVVEYDTCQELIASDVPVISINAFSQDKIGYGCMGLIMLFPISTHHIIVLYDAKMYPKYCGKKYIKLANEAEVFNLNLLQYISAETILYGATPFWFDKLTLEHQKIRKKNRDESSVFALGDDTHRMIGVSLRKTILEHEFSFGKVRGEFSSIPFTCREAVPRKWEKEWEEKLVNKIDIFPELVGTIPKMQYNVGITKKEIRRGCVKMTKAAKKYWME